jgi:hypothetical protein
VITSILSLTALSENAGGAIAAKASHIAAETSSKRFMPRLRFIDGNLLIADENQMSPMNSSRLNIDFVYQPHTPSPPLYQQ